MLKKIITEEFDLQLTTLLKDKPEVLKFILNHERKHLCITNLVREILHAENKIAKLITKETIQSISKDFAIMFAKAAIKLKTEQMLSETAVQQKIKEAVELEAYINTLDSESDASVYTKP